MEDIFRKLITYPTISGNTQAMHQLLRYVADFVTERGMHVAWFESNGFESIVATVKPGYKTPRVMLAAHADVVPAAPAMFQLRREQDRYTGRGVLDMKFAIAAYLQIIDDIRDDISSYDFGLMITSDEEVGGTDGVGMLVNEGYLPKVCILPDGGDNWQVQVGSKGILLYQIDIDGKSAHGSRPWLGDNALTKILQLWNDVKALVPAAADPRASTATLTCLRGGTAPNQIPGSASMSMDIRTVGTEDYQRIAESVHAICRRYGATFKLLGEGSPTNFSLADPMIAPFVRLITEVTGVKVDGFYAPAASDARFFVPYGVPCVLVYPDGGHHHGPDEWLSVQGLEDFRQITGRYLDLMARTDSAVASVALTAA